MDIKGLVINNLEELKNALIVKNMSTEEVDKILEEIRI